MIEKLRHARRVSVPLVAIGTPDPAALIKRIAAEIWNGGGEGPVVRWDVMDGCAAVNQQGQAVAGKAQGTEGSPVGLLSAAARFPAGTICFVLNAQDFLGDATFRQGAWNLRDLYKRDRRMLILLGPSIDLPVSLQHDVVVLDEELPTEAELEVIVRGQDAIVADKRPGKRRLDADELTGAVAAVRGLSAFQAEQATAMALRKEGIDLAHLWESKRALIEQTKGLSVDRGTATFADVGGLAQIRSFGERRFQGPRPPRVVVRVEEVEKVMAGAAGDTSGTSQDALQVLLNAMQDEEWEGLVAYGPPGSGKSLFSQVLARTFGCLSITLDLGACKGSLVGQSEQQVRAAVKVLKAVGGKDVFFVATCNRMDTIPPELQRRFTRGIWMFDLPTDDEREAIWQIHRSKCGIPEAQEEPDDDGWSGANIRDCCDLAEAMGCTLVEAAQYVVPAGTRYREVIERARREAAGVFLSADRPGVYRPPEEERERPDGGAGRVIGLN
ncbi:MAG: AAA family ATPase [Gemmatimonadota bacterium]